MLATHMCARSGALVRPQRGAESVPSLDGDACIHACMISSVAAACSIWSRWEGVSSCRLTRCSAYATHPCVSIVKQHIHTRYSYHRSCLSVSPPACAALRPWLWLCALPSGTYAWQGCGGAQVSLAAGLIRLNPCMRRRTGGVLCVRRTLPLSALGVCVALAIATPGRREQARVRGCRRLTGPPPHTHTGEGCLQGMYEYNTGSSYPLPHRGHGHGAAGRTNGCCRCRCCRCMVQHVLEASAGPVVVLVWQLDATLHVHVL